MEHQANFHRMILVYLKLCTFYLFETLYYSLWFDNSLLHYRTMQTAAGVFGGESYKDGIDVTPLMVANVGNSERPAISSLNRPPFLALELCREHLVRLLVSMKGT